MRFGTSLIVTIIMILILWRMNDHLAAIEGQLRCMSTGLSYATCEGFK